MPRLWQERLTVAWGPFQKRKTPRTQTLISSVELARGTAPEQEVEPQPWSRCVEDPGHCLQLLASLRLG